MSNQAKLGIIFNKYNISSRATKNFINYFMSNAKFNTELNHDAYYRYDYFETISNHEDDRYEFIISNDVNGKRASASHEADENFNFNITAEISQTGEIYNDEDIHIYNNGDGFIAIESLIRVEGFRFKYVVNKSRWTAEKLAELFPDGLPDGVDPNNLKDFEPLLINEDWCFDDYITPVKKIKDCIIFSGDSFDIAALGDGSTKLELELSGGEDSITEDGNISIVTGSLSNSESGESIDVDKITKLEKIGDSYKLTLKYDEEFDTATLGVTTFNNISNGNYGSVSQNYTSYVSGYVMQIPIQRDGAYKTKSKALWYAAGDSEHTIGMNFCNLCLGNLDTDKVRIEIERVESKSNTRRFKVHGDEIFTSINGTEYPLHDYYTDEIISYSASLVSLIESVTVPGSSLTWKAEAFPTASQTKTAVGIKTSTQGGSADLTGVVTITANNQQPVFDDDVPRADLRIYLNNILRARAYGGSIELTRIYENIIWPATSEYYQFYGERGDSNKLRLVLYDESGNIITDNASFSEIAQIYNYGGCISNAYLNLDSNETVVFNFEKKADKYIASSYDGSAFVMASEKDITSNIKTGIHIFNRREWDSDVSVVEKSKQDIDIPVNLKIISLNGEKITDLYPYFDYYSASIEIDKPKEKVEYSHKTDTFMITTPNSGGFDIVNAFYKIGFYALDGSNESSEELARLFANNACFTVHYKNIYGTSDDKGGYCLYIKPRPDHINDDTFYSVSNSFVAHNLSSPIIMVDFGGVDGYNICKTALLPIVEFNHDKSSYNLRGLMYMDLYNADDDTQINRNWSSRDNATISVHGEDALDTSTILITKI
jgi:hypothetical protein